MHRIVVLIDLQDLDSCFGNLALRLRDGSNQLTALAGRLSALDIICGEHGIGTTGEIVLLFVAAPALWGELSRLYGILANDSARGTSDEHLLWQLLGHSIGRRELARELDPDSPLLHHGLIRASDRHRPFQALSANPIVVKLLAGSAVDDDEYVRDLSPTPPRDNPVRAARNRRDGSAARRSVGPESMTSSLHRHR